jgi:hypothetical protein
MVALIHNLLTTDYVMRIHDDDCVMGLELVERRRALIEELARCPGGTFTPLSELFGISGICNVLGAIRLARHLKLGPEDNVVTIATDGFDRYPSVLADLAGRSSPIDRTKLSNWFESVFRASDPSDILDVRPAEEKNRLFAYKEQVWSKFGYSHSYLEEMKAQSFWDAEFGVIESVDRELAKARKF